MTNCKNCGAPLAFGTVVRCEYCGTVWGRIPEPPPMIAGADLAKGPDVTVTGRFLCDEEIIYIADRIETYLDRA